MVKGKFNQNLKTSTSAALCHITDEEDEGIFKTSKYRSVRQNLKVWPLKWKLLMSTF